MTEKYTFVTVACLQDVAFMHMQARSLARYVAPDLIHEIIVIENGPPALPDGWRYRLKRDYGALATRVKFVPASTIAAIPATVGGWFSQQILKLTVANTVKTKHYLVLDAKNHFIFPYTRAHAEANGKPRLFVHGYEKHPLRRYLDPILTYFDLPAEHVNRLLPTTPPFYMNTSFIKELMEFMAAKEKRRFEQVFCESKIRFTEFFLISAFILSQKHKFEDYYDLSDGAYSIIWRAAGGDDRTIEREIKRSEQRQAPFFSVHRGAIPLLSDTSRRTIAAFWQRRGLFPDEKMGQDYLIRLAKRGGSL